MGLFKKKQVYEEQEVELNVSVARARRKKWFWILIKCMIISLILFSMYSVEIKKNIQIGEQ